MAAGTVTWFNIAKGKISTKPINFGSDTFKVALTTSTQAIAATFVGTSTDCRYSDLTNEVASGGGYTTGGATLGSVTWTQATATWTFDAADTSWTSSTITAKYAICYDNTLANKDLCWFFELDTGGSVSTTNGTLLITWNASGIFTLE